MNSLRRRLLFASGLLLLAFVTLAGLALENAFRKSLRQAQEDRMKGVAYGVLGAIELSEEGRVEVMENELPARRLSQVNSGLGAFLLNEAQQTLWRSSSMLEDSPPSAGQPVVGQWIFGTGQLEKGTDIFQLRFGVEWMLENENTERFTLMIWENRIWFVQQMKRFQRTLWGWLLIVALGLVVLEGVLLRWGLRPLSRVAQEVGDVEKGRKERIEGSYPEELEPLTTSLNSLLHYERAQQIRYRNALDDLAHSLKTPLSVLRNVTEVRDLSSDFRSRFREQINRVDQILSYQVRKAATAGRRPFAQRLNLRAQVEKTTRALSKVYQDKGIEYENLISEDVSIAMEEGDLLEILGNLLDNASKWGRRKVQAQAERKTEAVEIIVEDDGTGFPSGQIPDLLQRGARADQTAEGQGIGLAVVHEIVTIHGGQLELGQSSLGGARVRISIPEN